MQYCTIQFYKLFAIIIKEDIVVKAGRSMEVNQKVSEIDSKTKSKQIKQKQNISFHLV